MPRMTIVMVLAAPLAACAAPSDTASADRAKGTTMEASADIDREKAIAAGRDYVREKFPDFVEDRKTPTATDKGDTWEFTYELPADMLGGAPVVILSKADLSVVKAYRTQ